MRIIALPTLALALTGCFPLLPSLTDAAEPPPESGEAALLVTVHAATMRLPDPHDFPAPETLRVTLTRPRGSGEQTLQREIPFHGGPVSVSLEHIETGHWSVAAELLDEENIAIFSGTGEAYVQNKSTVTTQMSLEPVPGKLEVHIELDNECIYVGGAADCLADLTDRGRINLAPTPTDERWNQDIDWDEGDPIGPVSVSSLVPGDYEFQIVFYVTSRTPGNTLYEGHWSPFRIYPGRTTTIVWQPDVGALTVDVHVHRPPPPPTNLTATWADAGVLLEWTVPDAADGSHGITHYNVWHRTGPKVEIAKLQEVAGEESTSWLDEAVSDAHCDTAPNEGLYYVVTAVNDYGLASLRSNEVDACITRKQP